jgi:hypothetical protein
MPFPYPTSGSPTLNACCGSSVSGRFRYSDLKEAALSGAADYGI